MEGNRIRNISKDLSGLKKVVLTGQPLRSFGQIDDDPRLHLVVFFMELISG